MNKEKIEFMEHAMNAGLTEVQADQFEKLVSDSGHTLSKREIMLLSSAICEQLEKQRKEGKSLLTCPITAGSQFLGNIVTPVWRGE